MKLLYGLGGLPFWSEAEIELRELFQVRIINTIRRKLSEINPAWRFIRVEGPLLAPVTSISKAYDDKDVFKTNHEALEDYLYLRPETTNSSYEAAKNLGGKFPLCVYQIGKSFRRELNDGATAAKLRFNEFWQIEFQCIYSNATGMDYREALLPEISKEIERFTKKISRVVDSDRLPDYSESTLDIELLKDHKWKEVASCSIRNDFHKDFKVCEIAIGLDRIVALSETN